MEAPVFLEKFGTGHWVGVKYVMDKCPLCNGTRTMMFLGNGKAWGCSKCKKGGDSLDLFRQHLSSNPLTAQYVEYVQEPVPPEEVIVVSKYVNPYAGVVVPMGFGTLDAMIGGFGEATMTIFTGRRGEGKSTALGQISLNVIQNGHNVCFYSGELSAGRFQAWLFSQAAGSRYMESHIDQFGATRWMVQKRAEDCIRQWMGDRMVLYDNTKIKANDRGTILRMFARARQYYGSDLFIVDNLMTAKNDMDGADDALRAQANFAAELLNFARENNVAVVLVAHPKKGDHDDINDGVSGLSDITNLASNVIQIKRCNDQERANHGCDSLITVAKNRDYGDTGSHRFSFDIKSRRFTPLDGSSITSYGWTKLLERN